MTLSTSSLSVLRRPGVWIGLAVSVVSLVILFSVVNVGDLLTIIHRADLRLVVLGALLIGLASFLRAWRWKMVLRPGTSFWAIFHADNIGSLTNNVLPLRAGEAARTVVLSRSTGIPLAEILSTVVITRITDLVGVLALLGLVIPALDVPESVRIAGYGALLLVIVFVGLVAFGALSATRLVWIFDKFGVWRLPGGLAHHIIDLSVDFTHGLQSLRQGKRLAALVLSTAAVWLCYAMYYLVLLNALTPTPLAVWAFLATCTASLSTAVPSSPAYVGVYDAVVAFTMTPYIGQDAAVGYAIILHGIEFIVVLLFGFISLTASGATLNGVAVATLTESSLNQQGFIPNAHSTVD